MALSLAEFNRMVEDHGPALYRMAFRMLGDRHEAEDLVQEAFRSAWKSRASFQPRRGDQGMDCLDPPPPRGRPLAEAQAPRRPARRPEHRNRNPPRGPDTRRIHR